MFVRFKQNWKWAERGIYLHEFSAGQRYRESGKCSDTEIMGEAAALALDLGIAEKVDGREKTEKAEKEPEKKPYSGKPHKTGKGKRQY